MSMNTVKFGLTYFHRRIGAKPKSLKGQIYLAAYYTRMVYIKPEKTEDLKINHSCIINSASLPLRTSRKD